jgi:uncharacterized C2H2 Zn-finger protein
MVILSKKEFSLRDFLAYTARTPQNDVSRQNSSKNELKKNNERFERRDKKLSLETVYMCGKCRAEFTKPKELNEHLLKVHGYDGKPAIKIEAY